MKICDFKDVPGMVELSKKADKLEILRLETYLKMMRKGKKKSLKAETVFHEIRTVQKEMIVLALKHVQSKKKLQEMYEDPAMRYRSGIRLDFDLMTIEWSDGRE